MKMTLYSINQKFRSQLERFRIGYGGIDNDQEIYTYLIKSDPRMTEPEN